MTKVKILSADHADILERMVNEFVAYHVEDILSIKFSTSGSPAGTTYSAMIIYEED